jgi:hypothetical protein
MEIFDSNDDLNNKNDEDKLIDFVKISLKQI